MSRRSRKARTRAIKVLDAKGNLVSADKWKQGTSRRTSKTSKGRRS